MSKMIKFPLFVVALLPFLSAISVNGHPDSNRNLTRNRRAALSYVWPDGLVPYTFNDNFDNQKDRQDFVAATEFIMQRTCVKFRERQDGDRYWLIVTKGGCCSSHGGRLLEFRDKGQPITFDSGHVQAFYLHELDHALGFPHEQDRPDRSEFIYWDPKKEEPKCTDNPQNNKVGNLDNAALETMFDYVSLMADWTECYWPVENVAPKDIPLGPGGSDDRTFSVVDIERINSVYDCKGCFGYRFKNIKLLASYQRPVEGGHELDGNTFYICRVYHEGHLLIGKSRPDDDPRCWAAFDGGETEYKDRFDVLTDPYQSGFRWERRPDDFSIPGTAIKGGRTKDRETIYIARCLINEGDRNTVIPGFVLQSNGREARVPYNGGTRKCDDFEYLVCG